jgi:hypothetical protein
MVPRMNNAADAHGASTGRETGTFLPFLGVNLLDPSSAGDPIEVAVAPYSTKLVPVRSDTSDHRTQYIIQDGAKMFRLWSLEHLWVHGLRLLGEDTSTAQADGNRTKLSTQIADESKKAIEALTGLADNWNGNGGRAPTAEAISAAKALVERLSPHLKDIPFFYPAPKGGIVAEMGAGGDRLTIILESDFLLGVSFVAGAHEMKEFDTTTRS